MNNLIIGILPVLIGGLITFQFYRVKAFKSASERFRTSVLKELEGLYPTPSKWPSQKMQIIDILKDKFPKLEIAVAEFRCHLGWFKRRRFDNAWQQYYKEYYFDYVPIKGESHAKGECVYSYDNTNKYYDNFKHNVDNLLKFAKQT